MRISSPRAVLALLTLLNFLNYVDRYLVAAVSPAFARSLSLSKFETGLSISAFMVGYFVTSPFFGRLGDRARDPRFKTHPLLTRTSLIASGVFVWSLATAGSGLAKGPLSLVLARVAVGIGEASYATVAPTIIDDLAPEGRKNKWLAIFYLAIPVGSALGYLLGGMIEHHYGWRAAFFVAGGPGVLLALLVFFVREPPVTERETSSAKPRRALHALFRESPLYVACVVGSCAYTFALGGFAAWVPAFLEETHHMPLEKADFGFGVVAVVTGILGTAIGGTLADRGLPKDVDDETRIRRYLRFCGVATAIAIPASVAVIFAPSQTTFFVAIFVCEMALFASTSPMNAVVLGSVPHALRTTAMAVSIFCIHAFGDFPSPPLIGAIAGPTSLRVALAILPLTIAAAAAAWWFGARAKLVRRTHAGEPK